MGRNAIVTASDRKYGDFLIEHWLRSLRVHSRLEDTDVVVLDYGLSVAQRHYLMSNRIGLVEGTRDGHVTVIRYRELKRFLEEAPHYDQVLLCDSGDIVFQGDIEPVFAIEPESYRAVPEDCKSFFSTFVSPAFFDRDDRDRLSECFIRNPMINGGFVVAPRKKMIHLAETCLSTIKDWTRFGPDQIVLNGVLHAEGHVALDSLYNYVLATAREGVVIRDGIFHTGKGRKPLVVHNAGNLGILRPVNNFGYGPACNHLKEDVYTALQTLYASTEGLFKTQELFLESRRLFHTRLKELKRKLSVPPWKGDGH